MLKKALAAITMTSCLLGAAHAAYPERPVTIIVPFPPGQTGDLIARMLGENLSGSLGQPFIIENRGGAGGTVGTRAASQAKPDGYTLLLTSTGPFAIAPALYSNVGYDPLKDFTAIAPVATTPQVLAANPQSGIDSLDKLLAQARAKELTFSSAGTGSTQHLTMEWLKKQAGFNALHVPFRGSVDAQTQVIGGLIPFLFDSLPAILPQIKAGRLTALAVAAPQRSAYLKDVPTLAELGYPGIDTVAFFGLMAPAGLDAATTNRLNEAVTKALSDPKLQERMLGLAMTVSPALQPAPFADYLKREVDKFHTIVKDTGVTIAQ